MTSQEPHIGDSAERNKAVGTSDHSEHILKPLPKRVVSFSPVISTPIDDLEEEEGQKVIVHENENEKIASASAAETVKEAVPTTPVTPSTPDSSQRIRRKLPRAPTPHPKDFPRLFLEGDQRQSR